MKRIISLILLLAALTVQAQPLRQSTVTTHSVRSAILGEEVSYNLYLPVGYDAASAEQYPVIYLLHGLYGVHTDWMTLGHMKDVADELVANGELVPTVIIMPDAGDPDVHNQWNGYFNMPGHAYEDFFFHEFIPTVERDWNVKSDKQHRAVMGLSMGGGGSTVYAQHHPDMFSSCYSMSGWLDEQEPDPNAPHDKLWIVRKSVRDNSAIDFVANASPETLEQLRTVGWFFDCGDDDFLLDVNVRMYQAMRQKHVYAQLRVRDGWHSWEYWHTALRLSLPFASRNFK